MTPVDDAAVKFAGGVATALIGKLGLLLIKEYQLLSGLRGEVVLLRDDAAMMNALLRMLAETDDGAVDHFVREWMKQVRELSYDAEDCIDVFVRRISWASWVGWSLGRTLHRLATMCPRRRLAIQIEELRARAFAIGERHALYGVYGQALQPSIAFGSRDPTSSTPRLLGLTNNVPVQFVGIHAEITSLSDKITLEQPDKMLKVFSIFGFGGVGKTTLAVEVCRKLEAGFPYQAMVSVSQAFDASKDLSGLLLDILEQFMKEKKEGKEEHFALGHGINNDVTSLAVKLTQHLAEKRYLIVIDDVWTISAWSAIRAMLPENKESSRIIVTTRRETVARECSSHSVGRENIHHMEPLNSEDAKLLFVTRVFGQQVPLQFTPSATAVTDPACPSSSTSTSVPEEKNDWKVVQVKMDEIIKKCGGLPLAIVSVASVLASYNSPSSIDMWTRVCNSISTQLESHSTLEGMMQIITFSYNHLPHHLKDCTMYLSIFPEDYLIDKERLLRRWISEGLIPEKRGWTLQEVAEAYYDELLSRTIIQPGIAINGTVKHCRVHDIIREVILTKSLEANFVSLVGGPCGGTSSYDHVRRLSIHGDVGYVAEERSMQHARSLSTFCGQKNDGLGKLLDRLTKFSLLRVLDLEDCKDVKNRHMKQVCQLFLLRFLNLNETDITMMPSEVSNLQHLQILWLYDTRLNKVPQSVTKLKKLEHMSFRNRDNPNKYLRIPRGVSKMKSLQVLDRLELRKNDSKLAKEIGKLVQLQILGIVFFSNCGDSVLTELASSIDNMSSLRELCIEEVPAKVALQEQMARKVRAVSRKVSRIVRPACAREVLVVEEVTEDVCARDVSRPEDQAEDAQVVRSGEVSSAEVAGGVPAEQELGDAPAEVPEREITEDEEQVAGEVLEAQVAGGVPAEQELGNAPAEIPEREITEDEEQVAGEVPEAQVAGGVPAEQEQEAEEEVAQQGQASDAKKVDFLDRLQSPPQLLRFLLIDRKIDTFPCWVESLTQLVHIELRSLNLQSTQIYSVLYKLPSLLKITLGIGCCCEHKLVAKSCYKFPVLKELAIVEDDGTQKIVEFQSGAMDNLEKLTMSFYNEKELNGVKNLIGLKEVELCWKGSRGSLDTALNALNEVNQSRQTDKFKVIVKNEN